MEFLMSHMYETNFKINSPSKMLTCLYFPLSFSVFYKHQLLNVYLNYVIHDNPPQLLNFEKSVGGIDFKSVWGILEGANGSVGAYSGGKCSLQAKNENLLFRQIVRNMFLFSTFSIFFGKYIVGESMWHLCFSKMR